MFKDSHKRYLCYILSVSSFRCFFVNTVYLFANNLLFHVQLRITTYAILIFNNFYTVCDINCN